MKKAQAFAKALDGRAKSLRSWQDVRALLFGDPAHNERLTTKQRSILTLMREAQAEYMVSRESFSDPHDVAAYAQRDIGGLEREAFAV